MTNKERAMREALINARSLLRAFGGDLSNYSKSEADAGHIDSVMWACQIQIEKALS